MMKRLLLICCCLVLVGCATPDFNYRAKAISISEPPIGNIQTAYVGDIMLRQGKYAEHDAIYLPEKVDAGWLYDLLPGYYLKKGEDEDTETYMPSGGTDGGGVDKAALADPWSAVMAYKEKDVLCIITVFNATSCSSPTNFIRKKRPIFTDDSFQQTLIYSGKIGNKINVGYREFSNNLARPAFNNNVEYDLDSSNVIGYKGARIKVIEATNEHIKYEVIRNFNAAAM